MRYLNALALREALPIEDAVDAMRLAFGRDMEVPVRSRVGASLFMPGRVGEISAIKVVSTVPGRPAGIVVVFGADGAPIGMVDGPELTKIRTGAASGLATELLAPEGASTLAMLGAGAMAFDQVAAVRAVRDIDRVIVWSRTEERARVLADRIGGETSSDPDEAVSQADVISCATPATAPLFSDGSVRTAAHINAVGAFTPEMVEVPTATLQRAFVVVDDQDAAAVEAGDLIQAGRLPGDATMSEVLDGLHPQGAEITVFKSVGIASQDVAAAARALARAAENGLGQGIETA